MIGKYWEAQVSKKQQSTLKNYAVASATTTNQKSPDSYHIISQKEKDLFDWVNILSRPTNWSTGLKFYLDIRTGSQMHYFVFDTFFFVRNILMLLLIKKFY